MAWCMILITLTDNNFGSPKVQNLSSHPIQITEHFCLLAGRVAEIV